jgi:hypothetical protein
MHGDDFVKIRDWILFHGNDGTVLAGGVDEIIDAPKPLSCGGEYSLASFFLGEVKGQIAGWFGSVSLRCGNPFVDFRRRSGEFRFRARGEKNGSAFFRKQPRNRAPNPAARSSD